MQIDTCESGYLFVTGDNSPEFKLFRSLNCGPDITAVGGSTWERWVDISENPSKYGVVYDIYMELSEFCKRFDNWGGYARNRARAKAHAYVEGTGQPSVGDIIFLRYANSWHVVTDITDDVVTAGGRTMNITSIVEFMTPPKVVDVGRNEDIFEVVHSEDYRTHGIMYNDEVILRMGHYIEQGLETLAVTLNRVKAALPEASAGDVYRIVINRV